GGGGGGGEGGGGGGGGGGGRGHRHQPVDDDPPLPASRPQRRARLLRREAPLRRLPRDVDLEEGVDGSPPLRAESVEGLEEAEGVDGVEEVGDGDGGPRLVPLERADEVPARSRGEGGGLRLEGLHAALAEVADPEGEEGPGDVRADRLRDGEEDDLAGRAGGARRGGGDPGADGGEVRPEGARRRRHE